MRHSDYIKAIQAVENVARGELLAALRATGGCCTWPINDEDNMRDPIIIVGAFKQSPGAEDILFTRAEIINDAFVEIYGVPWVNPSVEEQRIEYIEPGYIGYIIDSIENAPDLDVRCVKAVTEALLQIEQAFYH